MLAELIASLPAAQRTDTATLVGELRRRAADEHTPRSTQVVTVCTIHKAKGLEWEVVLLPRLTEGSLPSV